MKTQLYIKITIGILSAIGFGCGKIQKKEFPQTVTFNKNIKSIFIRRCSACHNENWPSKNWLDYDIAYKNASKIKKMAVDSQIMPPNGMPLIERIFIKKWIERGMPK